MRGPKEHPILPLRRGKGGTGKVPAYLCMAVSHFRSCPNLSLDLFPRFAAATGLLPEINATVYQPKLLASLKGRVDPKN